MPTQDSVDPIMVYAASGACSPPLRPRVPTLPSDPQRDSGCHRGSGENAHRSNAEHRTRDGCGVRLMLNGRVSHSLARAPGPDEEAEVGGADDAIAIDVGTLDD